MNHLSGLDATFLHLESPEMPMHVGSLCVLDLPQGFASDDFFEYAKQRVAERMHLADLFTRKLALIPFDLSNPVWVEDEDIDIDYHVRHVTLPKPGTNRLLQQYVARLHSSLLDRSRPLWEFFIIDGLKSGQVALYTKAHHAGMDGQAGIAVAQAIFDLEATGRVVKPPRPKVRSHRYQLGMAELGGAALRNTAMQVVKLAQTAPQMLRALKDVVAAPDEATGKRQWGLPQNLKLFGPRTMLNTSITNQRTFAGRTIPLAETKFIGKTLGGTLNDVVLTTTAGALRRYLKEHNNLPDKTLLAAIPVSLREAGDTSANNQVSFVTSVLGTDIADPVKRLAVIREASEANKRMMSRVKTAMPTDFPLFGAPWLMSGVAAAVSRSGLLNSIPPISNLIISNVPGSPVPLYFAGAKLASFYPVSIAVHSMALNVTVQSYAGRLDYGLIACRRAMPDVADLGDYLLSEHQVLLAKAQEAAAKTLDAETSESLKAEPKLKLVSAKSVVAPKSRVKAKASTTKRTAARA
ncbi:wax ester/triacylglycerol synthase family O-acyltransferase [Variovorax sp. PCZ-1]|uniref:WS/DGAT/MGAT family O-acyltransferase n=1 Tax=Variovorax sp. PCZ-1 TaxID=2835533 RepID=UPI001BD0A3B2|nr:wax ester/triacylglycerol synthase family O-acyltransferase [Variovorax sp. PCZ-1]MBS7809153.1 wax ester/triacylglycerol synthase family O-acyltransferase [Variovorax sp. PCZ-1]